MGRERVDVVVIGSGAGGAPAALSLARAGARVVVLEKGPFYGIGDFDHDEIRVCRRDFWVPWAEDEPHTVRSAAAQLARPSREGWTSACVGGATVHMSGFFYRLHDCDFSLRRVLGEVPGATLADWPITLDELLPYYDVMESELGVSGDGASNPLERRSRPYPLPPLAAHPASRLVDEAAARRGWHAFATPRAVLSAAYGARPPCNLCAFCGDYGCENASKSSTLASLLPAALATERCVIRSGCMALRLEADAQDRVRAVEYEDAAGVRRVIEARVVVLAASAVESARLLLLSQSGRHPQGLGNANGLVGKHLSFSTFGKVSAVFERSALSAALGVSRGELGHRGFLQRSIQDDYWSPSLGALGKGGTYNFMVAHPNVINAATKVASTTGAGMWGAPLLGQIRAYHEAQTWLEAEIFSEYFPHDGCYVDLDPRVRDRFGLAVARITASVHPLSASVNATMVQRLRDFFGSFEPAPISLWTMAQSGTTMHLQHGTCRFGTNAEDTVLDPSCRMHGIEGLYVLDGSFMPSSGGVPATATIIANSFRVSELLAARMRRGELN
ncbi:MAG: GMC family oxidoreductase [Myxococcota bacterium]|jgi:choline dehydrogenase-like flavoprotein|nr:GMC family oxidoreductase [Myxococcota bacterium]